MAPPASRRPGFSRRAQYGLFIGYVVAVAGVLFALMLLIVAIIDPRGFQALKGAALDATTPVSAAGRGATGVVGDALANVGDYFRAGAKNAALRQALEDAQRELTEAQAMRHENERLKQLLELRDRTDDIVTVTRVVGSSFDSSRRLATLSAGTGSGVAPGQPVRAPEGLIGRVLETGRWASRVLLITDGTSNVPVRLVRDGTPAIAVGRGDGTLELRTLEVGRNPFQPGDVLVTSGIGGIYPPNIPVARVLQVTGDTAIARPIASPARADFAIVQHIYQPAAGQPLDSAPPPEAVTDAPVAVPGEQPAARRGPHYQPGLQRPQPGLITEPAPPAQPQPQPQ